MPCAIASRLQLAWALDAVSFIHGQAYKGGPNTGVFLQITWTMPRTFRLPGQKYTFGIVKARGSRRFSGPGGPPKARIAGAFAKKT